LVISFKVHSLSFILFLLLFSTSVFAKESVSACGHHDYPPWNWEKEGKIVGVCAEITEKLFAKLGVDVDFTYKGPWKRCQKHIEAGTIDVNICSFANKERLQYSKYAKTPIGFNENAIFVKKGREFPYEAWPDLKNKKGVMMRGVSLGEAFDGFIKEHIEIKRVETNRQVFQLLALERGDFTAYGRYPGLAFLQSIDQAEQFSVLKKPVVEGKLYISMSYRSRKLHLLAQVEAFLQDPAYYPWVDELLVKYAQIYADGYKKPYNKNKNNDE